MVTIEIHETACRGCRMCVDICPTHVFEFDESERKARPVLVQDCISCLSCGFLCPSGAIRHQDVKPVRNFYRDMKFAEKMGRFL